MFNEYSAAMNHLNNSYDKCAYTVIQTCVHIIYLI